MKIKRILFPTDFSTAAGKALDHALVLAHIYNAELVMLHVEVPHGADPHNPNKEFPELDELFAYIRQQIAGLVDDDNLPVIKGTVPIREVVRRAISDATEILDFCELEEIDLIVMGTHGRTGIGHFVLGSTTEKVVHGSRIPVLTIHHGEDLLISSQGRYQRILAPIDFSEASKDSLKTALDLAAQFDAELIVAHVFEPVLTSPSFFSDKPSKVPLDPDLISRSNEALQKFAGDILPEGTPFKLRSGHVQRELTDLAKSQNVDLIVVANQGWNAIDRFLLGGTTEKLIRRSPVPVLVKPFLGEPEEID